MHPGIRLAAPALVAAIALSACGSTPPATPSVPGPMGLAAPSSTSPGGGTIRPGASSPTAGPTASTTGGRAVTITATTLALRLPAGRSRVVVAVDGRTLLVLGGLTAAGTTGSILRVDPASGTATSDGRLAAAVHDAAGAPLGDAWLVLGGGRTLAVASVQRVAIAGGSTPGVTVSLAGSLPAARADHAAVAVDREVIVVGGGRGGVPDPAVLATTDGARFRTIASLPVAVRYAAAVAVGGRVYLFGGAAASGDTAVIQEIDPATGGTRVVGRLPRTLSGAAAFVLGGRILVAGGDHAGRAVDTILSFDPSTGKTISVGRLPAARAQAGVAVTGDAAFLVGGEAGGYLDTVVRITGP
jgi:hypothetical protein